MPAKIISCVIIAIVHLVVAFIAFASMILAMNGFNESSATWGISLYIILQIVFLIVLISVTYFLIGFTQNKWQFSAVVASVISLGISFVLSIIFTIIAFFGGILATSIAWNNR